MLARAVGTPPRGNAGAGPWRATMPVVRDALVLMLGFALPASAQQSTDAGQPHLAFTGRLHWDAGIYRPSHVWRFTDNVQFKEPDDRSDD